MFSKGLSVLRGGCSGQRLFFKSPVLQNAGVFVRHYNKNYYKKQKDLKEEQTDLEKRLNSKNWIVRWAAKTETEKFKKDSTKFLFLLYGGFVIYGLFHFKDLYKKDKELTRLKAKIEDLGIDSLNEYERIRFKEMTHNLRERDELKLKEYKKLITAKEEEFYSDAKNVGKPFEFDASEFDGVKIELKKDESIEQGTLPAQDTSPFFDSKAMKYDEEINFEEKMVLMGRRRKWLMKKIYGDVLEVSCGTGRNLKYLDPKKINSITFLDSSKHMVEITKEKFKKQFPKFGKVGFVVGKAEDLIELADPQNNEIKYDTIIETFGVCSHKDPVKSLQNFGKLLKPGGRIILLEHGRSTYKFLNKHMDQRAPKRLETWGCRWNLDIGEILDDSGLEIVEENRYQMGTLWCVVAKNKGDPPKFDELNFFQKYLSSK